jgi:predicted Zn-dependent protease
MVGLTGWRPLVPRTAAAAFLLVGLSGCSGADFVLPQVSDAEISQASLTVSSGAGNLPKFHRSDDENRRMLQDVAQRLTASAPALCQYAKVKGCTIDIKYDDDDTVNAYADGENHVTVYRGLLELLQSEDEIAAVVGHEFGHHLGNHIEEKTQNAMIGAIIGGLLAAGAVAATGASDDPNAAEAVSTGAGVGAGIGALSYSKSEEREADLLAAYLLARANYDLHKAARVWWVLAEQNKEKVTSTLFDTHPAGPERMAAWDKAIIEVENSPNKLPAWKP